jgi:plasmid maintenance system antidote protein VapI
MTGTTPEYRAHRARAMAYGTWRPFVADPDPVREHVRQLREHGGTYRAIASAAGVSAMAVHALATGQGQVRAETAEALMGLTPDRLAQPREQALGTAQMMRALVAMGHSQERISRALGVHPDTVRHLVHGTSATVAQDLRADTRRLYDAWWDRRPPEQTREERTAAEAARRRAERAGWCTGGALDDERLEDRSYAPRAGWRRAEGTGPAPEDPLDRHAAAWSAEAAPQPAMAQRREPQEELEAAG